MCAVECSDRKAGLIGPNRLTWKGAAAVISSCPRCAYSLDGLPTVHTCPECGLEYDRESSVFIAHPRARRSWPIVAISVLFVVGIGAWVWTGTAVTLLVAVSGLVGSISHLVRRRYAFAIVERRRVRFVREDFGEECFTCDAIGAAGWSHLTGAVVIKSAAGRTLVRLPPYFFGSPTRAQTFVSAVNEVCGARRPEL